MDPVDILDMALNAARMIRSSRAPDDVLAEACRRMRCGPFGDEEPRSVRVTRLIEEAGPRREELMAFLREHCGPLYLNRHEGWGDEQTLVLPYEPDAEVPDLLEYVEAHNAEQQRRSLFDDGFPPFKIGTREAVHYIEFEEGVAMPETVRGLIDYPLEKPVLFAIEVGKTPWFLWDILSAFADQYALIYQEAQRFGVWGHDLSDLWIERLFYYPERALIYPYVGS
jgi:hypothetical protein